MFRTFYKIKGITEILSKQNKTASKLHLFTTAVRSLASGGDVKTVDIRNNFHKHCEEGLNKQINLELCASYAYFCMATCMRRNDVALHGYAQFFAAASAEERHHAEMMADFINMRGGTVEMRDVTKPGKGPFHDPAVALAESLDLERKVLKAIEELHQIANTHNDMHLIDFLEANFIPEGYEGIKQLTDMLTNVQWAGPGVGVVLLDLDLLRNPPKVHGMKKD